MENSETETPAPLPKSIVLVCREWRGNQNGYCLWSCKIFWDGRPLVKINGNGSSQFQEDAIKWLAAHRSGFPSMPASRQAWGWLQELGVELGYETITVERKKDL